jgi:uncharacterized protein YuzE
MKVNYDSQTDILTIIFTGMPVAESDEDKPDVILDYMIKVIPFRSKSWMRRGV